MIAMDSSSYSHESINVDKKDMYSRDILRMRKIRLQLNNPLMKCLKLMGKALPLLTTRIRICI